MGLTLNWTKCQGDVWCDFHRVDLSHIHFDNLNGVYIIWSGKITIYVGSGFIRDKISENRNDIRINSYKDLKVVWAHVDEQNLQGVEKYLANTLLPREGERHPEVIPIAVNFPWQ